MDHKRRKLDDIEDAVMKEDDPEQLATLRAVREESMKSIWERKPRRREAMSG